MPVKTSTWLLLVALVCLSVCRQAEIIVTDV